MNTAQEILDHFGFQGHELLMNEHTGSIATAATWASEAHEWANPIEEFDTLIEVTEPEEEPEGNRCPRCPGSGCSYCLMLEDY